MTEQAAPAPAAPPAAGETEQPAPLQYYLGQPISREQAAQRMEDLRADPEFGKRVAARDSEAFAEYNRMWRLSRGMPAAPSPAPTAVEINAETDARIVAAYEQHASVLQNQGYGDLAQTEILGRRPVPKAEHDFHVSQYEMRRKDAAFMARWSAGDMEAISIMRDHAIGKSLPVGTLEQIHAWQSARGLPLSE